MFLFQKLFPMYNQIRPLPSDFLLNEYQIIKKIGQGGFGTTYLCADKNLNRNCVLKEYTPVHLVKRLGNNQISPISESVKKEFEVGLSNFLVEAQNLAQFSHSNIARIYRFFEANGTGFFAMEYECGLSIRERLKEYGHNFSEFEIEAILKPILLGLKELHKKGKIHRDIKPDNIIIRPNGSPVLIDFGAVIDFEKMDPKDIDVIVTPDYAPIEQFNPRLPHGPWLDIYSLGATLYEMITGDVPPKSVERLNLDNLKSIKVIGRGKYSDQLLHAIDICLSLNYEDRPQSIDQLLALLDFDDDLVLRRVILGLTEKTLNHFLNWAKPNPDIYIDEFISFVICFPIIDLSWRIGRSVPTNELFGRIFSVIDIDFIESCEKQMYKFGFSSKLKNVSLASLKSRFDEYSASYLLDRKEDNWTYEITRKRCTKNCIKSTALDKDQFSSLMEEIIDRARGRVKNNFEKVFRNVTFCITTNGWQKKIVYPNVGLNK